MRNYQFSLIPEWEKNLVSFLVLPTKINLQNLYLEWSKYILAEKQYLVLCYKNTENLKLFQAKAKKNKLDLERVCFRSFDFNEIWCRDYLALPCRAFDLKTNYSTLKYLDFEFNYWGEKYQYSKQTEKSFSEEIFPSKELISLPLILEGGALSFNSQGILLASKESILKRNSKQFSCQEIEEILREFLGVQEIIWIEDVKLIGDDTDSHIDNLARFVREDTIVYLKSYGKKDPNHTDLLNLEKQLKKTRFKLIPVENYSLEKLRDFPTSYLNFVFLNQSILLPSYQDQKQESKVLKIFQALFPQKKIIFLDCSELILDGGGLHCASFQFPDFLTSWKKQI